MYPKEDRERILADLDESGLPAAAFCRQPGRPSRETIRAWRLQAERGELDVPRRAVRGRCEGHEKHRPYPEGTRREALGLLARGMRACDVARRLGVSSAAVVRSWARAAGGGAAIGPKGAVRVDEGARARIAELEAELAGERMANAALRELMRDPKSGDPASLSNGQKAGLGERLRRDFGYRLKDVLAFLGMSKSSYEYARRSLERRRARDEAVAARVRAAFEASGRTYGYRRVRASIALGADGGEPMAVSEREVRRAMREGRMRARRPRRAAAWSSYGGEADGARPANVPLAPDGSHDFSAPRPGVLAVTDLTEFAVGGSKVYLSPVIDCFDGEPAAWGLSEHPDAELAASSLEACLDGLGGGAGVTVHTDGGSTYRSGRWRGAVEARGAVRSMSRKGCCPDNARAEGFFGTVKEEFYYGRDWSRTDPARFRAELDAYLRWYVHGRLKAFREGGRTVYDTIAGRRRRLGYDV